MDNIIVDLSDPTTAGAIRLAVTCWAIAVLLTMYSIGRDLVDLRAGSSKKRSRPERRFIEPCAEGLHTYDEGACTTCKQHEPDLQP